MFTAQLIESDRLVVIDQSDFFHVLIDDILNHGWEDEPASLMQSAVVITEGACIAATLTWFAVDGQEWPDIVVVDTSTGEVNRYRRVETETAYRAERVI